MYPYRRKLGLGPRGQKVKATATVEHGDRRIIIDAILLLNNAL